MRPSPYVRAGLTRAFVKEVIDGDTVRVQMNGAEYVVRYIGMDAPESYPPDAVECLGAEAKEYNRELVQGKTVGLEKDVSETDRFGRLLRYVWLEDELVNGAVVAFGFAEAKAYRPDVRHQELLEEMEGAAREAGRGLWSVCP